MNKEKFCDYQEASNFAKTLQYSSSKQWRKLKRKELPRNIPTNPESFYKNSGWQGWKHFLGAEKFPSFSIARAEMINLGIRSSYEYRNFGMITSALKLPANPDKHYESEWKGWEHFLSQERKEFVSYSEAKKIVKDLNLKSSAEWRKLSKAKRPQAVPSNPREYYYRQWESWEAFLGATKKDKFLSYEDSKEKISKLGIKNASSWLNLPSEHRPEGVPSNPRLYYTKLGTWKGWEDFLSSYHN